MPNVIRITPVLAVKDVAAAVTFFTTVLGFTALLHRRDYAYVERDGVAFRILEAADAPYGNRRFAHYIEVRDVDALYAEFKPQLDGMPSADVYGPVDQSYGQRELLVLAPDGNLIAFGQPIGPRGADGALR